VDLLRADDVLSSGRAVLGESPRWDDRAETVVWIDVDRGEIWSATLQGGPAALVLRARPPLGALVLHEDGGLLWSVGDEWWRTGEARARTRAGLRDLRFNDAGVDSLGVVWSGTMRTDETMPTPGQGALYRLRPEHPPVVVEDGLVAANGIAWSYDGQWMYLVDSGPGTVRRARFAEGEGPVGTWTDWVGAPTGMADGIATDVAGGVWLACWGAGEVVRFDPRGLVTHRLRIPVPTVTALAFVGPDLDVLACTTSSQGLDPATATSEGRVFLAPAPVPGTPLHRAVATVRHDSQGAD
jgi:sugar lactone lactonase YvrE